MIAFERMGQLPEAYKLFREMIDRSVAPNQYVSGDLKKTWRDLVVKIRSRLLISQQFWAENSLFSQVYTCIWFPAVVGVSKEAERAANLLVPARYAALIGDGSDESAWLDSTSSF